MTPEAQRIHDEAMARAPKPDVRVRTGEDTSRDLTDAEKQRYGAGVHAGPALESDD